MSKNGGQMTRNMAENNIDKKIGGGGTIIVESQ